MRTVARSVVIVLFTLQLALFVRARFSHDRYLTWAPLDRHVAFRLEVRVAGRLLSPQETVKRYRLDLASSHLDQRPCHVAPCWRHNPRTEREIINILRKYETRYAEVPAQIIMFYRVNGGPEQRWEFPPGQSTTNAGSARR